MKNDFDYATHIQYDYAARIERNKRVLSDVPAVITPPVTSPVISRPVVPSMPHFYSSASRKRYMQKIEQETQAAKYAAKLAAWL